MDEEQTDEERAWGHMSERARKAYKAVLGDDKELCLAVAVVRLNGPHLLAPALLVRLLEVEGHPELYARTVDDDRQLYAEMKAAHREHTPQRACNGN